MNCQLIRYRSALYACICVHLVCGAGKCVFNIGNKFKQIKSKFLRYMYIILYQVIIILSSPR